MFRKKERFMDFYYEAYSDLRKMRSLISLALIGILIGGLSYMKVDKLTYVAALIIMTPLFIIFIRSSYGLSDLRKFKKALDNSNTFEHVDTKHKGDQTLVVVRTVDEKEYLLAMKYEIDGVCSDVTCLIQ